MRIIAFSARHKRAIALVAAVFVAAAATGFFLARPRTVLTAVTEAFIPDPRTIFGRDDLRILVVGLDYDYDRSDQETSASSRSDIIMAVHLDFVNHRVNELSVPRDMVATMPNGAQAKINEAQSAGGIAESQLVVSQWLGVPAFDRYVVLRIDTMKDLIDAIGGVDVAVENSDALMHQGKNGAIDYDDSWGHLHVHLAPGLQHLDGDRAVGYARFRHDWCSDPCRIMRQQQVIKAIVAKLKANGIGNVLRVRSLLGVIDRDVQTNFTTAEELSIATAFSDITPGSIRTAQVPYVGDVDLPQYGDSIVPDTVRRAQLVQSMLLDPPEPADTPAPALLANFDASPVHVRVENGSGVPGAAERVSDLLKKQGFSVDGVGDAARSDYSRSEIHGATALKLAAYKVQLLLRPTAIVALDSARSPDKGVVVIVGRDLASPDN